MTSEDKREERREEERRGGVVSARIIGRGFELTTRS